MSKQHGFTYKGRFFHNKGQLDNFLKREKMKETKAWNRAIEKAQKVKAPKK